MASDLRASSTGKWREFWRRSNDLAVYRSAEPRQRLHEYACLVWDLLQYANGLRERLETMENESPAYQQGYIDGFNEKEESS